MKRWIRRIAALLGGVTFIALLGGACTELGPPPSAGESCALTEDGGVLDVRGRANGLYGVQNDVVAEKPFATIADITRTGAGVDPASGKRWIGMKLSDPKTADFVTFTSAPAGRSLALVVDGQVASKHRVRVPITSGRVQVSCCNPSACDTWERQLGKGN